MMIQQLFSGLGLGLGLGKSCLWYISVFFNKTGTDPAIYFHNEACQSPSVSFALGIKPPLL